MSMTKALKQHHNGNKNERNKDAGDPVGIGRVQRELVAGGVVAGQRVGRKEDEPRDKRRNAPAGKVKIYALKCLLHACYYSLMSDY